MLLVAGVLVATQLGGVLTTVHVVSNDPEYVLAEQIIDERFDRLGGVTELVIVRSEATTVDEPSFRAVVERLHADIAALGPTTVQGVLSYYQTGDPSLVSRDRRSLLLPVLMTGKLPDAIANVHQLHAMVDAAAAAEGFTTFVTGRATGGQDFQTIAEHDLHTGELVALPIAFVVLVLVFGALAAALLPIMLAGVAIVIALGATAVVGQVFDLSFFVVNMATMMGLAVGIDYSLFVVSRYREERRRGRGTLDAITITGATASRAVLISGMVVMVALLGLLIVPINTFQSVAAGAILVVAAAVLASLTLLPAMLSLMGDRVDALRVPFIGRLAAAARRQGRPLWDRLAYAVMRRPILSLIVAVGLLAAAAVPNIGINTGAAGLSSLPPGTRARDGVVVLQREFLGGLLSPAQIVVEGDTAAADVQAAIARLQTALAADPDFGPSRLDVSRDGSAALITVPMVVDPTGDAGADAVRRLRDDLIPAALADADAAALVTGVTAHNVAYFDVARQYTPVVFGIVLSVSFVLLLVVFRSLIVPAKAILMNLLAVGAAYGLVVLVSQMGFAADLLGFQRVAAIEAWIPILLFAVLFGLSMDYHVFLLSRIRERFDRTGDNAESVAFGLRRTGALITGAALIMVAVFGGFAAGDLVMFQQVGFGLAAAVFIDATLIRSVVVPASMKLLGSRNWWLPRPLRWLPQVRLEGAGVLPPKPTAVLRKRRTR